MLSSSLHSDAEHERLCVDHTLPAGQSSDTWTGNTPVLQHTVRLLGPASYNGKKLSLVVGVCVHAFSAFLTVHSSRSLPCCTKGTSVWVVGRSCSWGPVNTHSSRAENRWQQTLSTRTSRAPNQPAETTGDGHELCPVH